VHQSNQGAVSPELYLNLSALIFLRSSAVMILMSEVGATAGPSKGAAATTASVAGVEGVRVLKRSCRSFFLSALSADSTVGETDVPKRSALFRSTSSCSALGGSTLAFLAAGASGVVAVGVVSVVTAAGVAASWRVEPNLLALNASLWNYFHWLLFYPNKK